MKINELVPWTREQQTQTKKQNPADFGNWLGEHEDWAKEPNSKANSLDNNPSMNWQKLLSPTQQSTGDEYYWQHQTQLQQSSLHFEALPQENQQPQPIIVNTAAPDFTTATKQETTAQIEYQPQLNGSNLNKENSNAYAKKFAPLMSELEQALEQSTLPQDPSNNQKATATNSNTLKVEKPSLKRTIQFKNNHLFIQGEQAELTLNLHSFTKHEQKELMQLIQNHLKKKGLLLSRLIINGVNND